jgi:hypothetical protein
MPSLSTGRRYKITTLSGRAEENEERIKTGKMEKETK